MALGLLIQAAIASITQASASPSIYFPPVLPESTYPLPPSTNPQPSYETQPSTISQTATNHSNDVKMQSLLSPTSLTISETSTTLSEDGQMHGTLSPTSSTMQALSSPTNFTNLPHHHDHRVHATPPHHHSLPHARDSLYHQLLLSIYPYLFSYTQTTHHHQQPYYHVQPLPPTRAVYPLSLHHQPPPSYPQHDYLKPDCAEGTMLCIYDKEYPTHEIQHAAEQHAGKLLTLYADFADLNTESSVQRPNTLEEETYLCPSDTAYVRPLRAVNTEGKWRVIVNNIKVHYETLTQTTRLEECLNPSYACPLVPACYESKCLQKSIYHRLLVYDPYDQYFPFAIEAFKFPASCACLLGF